MRKLVCSFLLAVLLAYSGEASAQDETSRGKVASISATSDSQVHTYKLYYRWNEVEIDRSYLNNSENIEQIVRHLQLSPQIDSIAIYSYASPEGVYEHNANLASARAKAARRFILKNLPEDSSLSKNGISLHPVAENWDGLREAVEKDYYRWTGTGSFPYSTTRESPTRRESGVCSNSTAASAGNGCASTLCRNSDSPLGSASGRAFLCSFRPSLI